MSPHIVLTGAYGHGNVGDDLLGTVTAATLRRDGHEVLLAAGGLGGLHADLDQRRSELWRRLGPDAHLLLGGGGLLNDHWGREYSMYFTSLGAAARARGARVSTAGIGIEPPRTWVGRQLARALGRLASPLGVRDAASLSIARKLHARTPLLGLDLGWLARQEIPVPAQTLDGPSTPPLVVLTIAGESVSAARRRAELLAGVVREIRSHVPDARFRLVAMQTNPLPEHDDLSMLRLVATSAGLPAGVIEQPSGVGDAAECVRGASLAIGYRLHGLLLGYLAGARIVALSRSEKVAHTFAHAPGALVLPDTVSDDAVRGAVTSALDGPAQSVEWRHFVDRQYHAAREHLRAAVAA